MYRQKWQIIPLASRAIIIVLKVYLDVFTGVYQWCNYNKLFPNDVSPNVFLRRCVSWIMRPLDDNSLGRCVPWMMNDVPERCFATLMNLTMLSALNIARRDGYKYSHIWTFAASFPIPTFMYLCAIYIFRWSVRLFLLQQNRWTYRSQIHECGNWERGRFSLAMPYRKGSIFALSIHLQYVFNCVSFSYKLCEDLGGFFLFLS